MVCGGHHTGVRVASLSDFRLARARQSEFDRVTYHAVDPTTLHII
jgi:hypothetical protein